MVRIQNEVVVRRTFFRTRCNLLFGDSVNFYLTGKYIRLGTISRTSVQSFKFFNMVTLTTKNFALIAIFSMQYDMVVSLHSRAMLRNKDLTEVLHQKSAAHNLQQSITKQYLITGSLAEQLRAKFDFLFVDNNLDDGLDALRKRFRFLFQSLDVPQDQIKLLDQTRQRLNEKYAAKILRLSNYFLKPTIYFT